jgi:outer membrane lipoprotein SlyB
MKRILVILLAALLLPLGALAADCVDCGTVKSVKQVEAKGSGIGLVAGGVLGGVLGNQFGKGTGKTLATVGGAAAGAYAGNEVEKNVKDATWKVVVDMDVGDSRSFKLDHNPGLAAGDRVRIENGQPVKLQVGH